MADYRKAALIRLRKYLNETVVDQIPPLAQLQRAVDELSLMETPAQESKPAYAHRPRRASALRACACPRSPRLPTACVLRRQRPREPGSALM